jgi:hypothetical protein
MTPNDTADRPAESESRGESEPISPSAEVPARGRNRGQFVKGEPGPGLRHGGRSILVRLALVDARRAALGEHRAAILTDLGGYENVGTLKADLVERYLETSLIAEWLGGNLLVDGVLTAKGKTRAAATLYLQVLDRLHRLTTLLGLERRARPVQNPADWIEGKA